MPSGSRRGSVVAEQRHADRRCLITGGASGIGAALARRFAAEGARVAVVDVRPVDGADLAIQADVADHAQVMDAFKRVESEWGGVDIVLNNAGVSEREPCLEVTVESWDRILAVNLTGAFFVAQAAARLMSLE